MAKELLVVFHLYYEEQLQYFIEHLSYIHDVEWDLLVTGNSLSAWAKEELKSFKDDVIFLETEKVGYDVWPFIKAVRTINIDDYDVAMKLHTKSSRKSRVNGYTLRGFQWRNAMVDALLKDRQRFEEVMSVFKSNKDVGLVCSAKVFTALKAPEDCDLLTNELDRIGLQAKDRSFCVGNILAVRASLLKPLVSAPLESTMFPQMCKTDSKGTLAHVYERIISLLAPIQGYGVYLMDNDAFFKIHDTFRKYSKPFANWLLSVDRRGENGEKYLTVLGMKFKLDNGFDGQY